MAEAAEMRLQLGREVFDYQPCIRGMRMTVYDVLEYLASGMTEQEIIKDFPYLTREDILASLSFAAARERVTAAVQP